MTLPVMYERLEGAVILAGSLYFYHHLNFSWVWFVVLLFVFDISMIGYMVDARIGAHVYNMAHSLIAPPLLLTLGVATGNHIAVALALIWFAHIGLDRALGYGLKFPAGFKQTHLGIIGKR